MTTGGSSEVIGEGIDSLQDRHGPFPVNQTTLSLSAADYHDAAKRASAGSADIYVRVHNDDGEVLHVESEGRKRVPRCVGDGETSLADRARTAVRESTGISCTIEEIVRVTIAGFRNADDPNAEPVYRLLVLFDASHDGGQIQNGVWESDPQTPEFV